HKLSDIILLTICGVLSGHDGWDGIIDFGHARLDFLKPAFFKVVVIIRLVIKRLFFLDLDEPHQRVHSSLSCLT
ncbi:transposase family protein, partial [Vibrio vulnificus]|uniref:transposase family protein n=1 Tax=Vibrio vulnificus TaxID=672 RepID=UPI004058EE09